MKLIVGLGNPGSKYENTRHNIGFMVLERFLRGFESVEKTVWKNNEKLKSYTAEIEWKPKTGALERVLLLLPQTYMNNSGMAVGLAVNYYKIDPSDVWVAHDELDLPLGTMRIRLGGAAAGHHGVESVIESLGTDKFWRFRLGIGAGHPHSGRGARDGDVNPKIGSQYIKNVDDYVLSPFGQVDHNKARELIKYASDAMSYALEKGLEKTMNRYNTK